MKQTSKIVDISTAGVSPDVQTAGADAQSNTVNMESSDARISGFNGTTWDRIRTGLVAVQTTFVGLLNSLGMGRYNATPPTLSDGNVVVLQMDANGNLKITNATLQAGEDIVNDLQKVEIRASYLGITTNATTVVKQGTGVFYGFTINNNGFTTAGTVTVYDNTAASGTKIGTYTIPLMPPGSVLLATTFFPPQTLNAAFSTGLTFVTATTAPAADITVLYR